MKILFIFSYEDCHILMNAQSSVFNSVTCIELGFLESGLSTTAPPKSVSHPSAAIHHTRPLPTFVHLSLPLSLPLPPLLLSNIIWPVFGFSHFPPHSHPTPHSAQQRPCLGPREQRLFPSWKVRRVYNCKYTLLYIIFS